MNISKLNSHMGRPRKYNTEEERLQERREYNKKWRNTNKNKVKEYNTQYAKDNKENLREYGKLYRLTQKGRAVYLAKGYRGMDKKNKKGECTITSDWIVENVFSGQVCHYCGESDWTKLGCDRIDNNLPHTPDNVVVCCKECNNKRMHKEYQEFMRLIKKVG